MGEVEELLIIERSECILASAKNGIGIDEILEAIVSRIPPPKGHHDHLRALVFNAQFDPYRGVVSYVRVVDGELKAGSRFMSMAHEKVYECTEVGVFSPQMRPTKILGSGSVGYVIANIKSLGDIDVGDTLTEASQPGARAARRLSQSRADGVLRPLPERGRRVRRPARRARKDEAQRRRALVRARDVGRARLRIPLRISRACCTWRSCKSGSSATSISISLRRRRRSSSA